MAQSVAIYTRLSVDRDGTQTATARQEEACQAFAVSRGWTVSKVYTDVDVSAFAKGVVRPGFEVMLDAIGHGEHDGILCWKVDRLVRSHADFERLWSICEDRGVLLASATEPIDSTSELGMIIVRLLVSFARLESANISVRTRAALTQAATNGRAHRSGRRPFGLSRDWSELVPDEAALIREAAQRVIAGESCHTIVTEWNAAGVRTPGTKGKPEGSEWRPSSLARLLRSPHLAALREHHGEIVADGDWPAIITVDQHRRLNATLGRNTAPRRSRQLLSGIARCGLCGHTLVAKPRHDKVRQYVCHAGPGRPHCGKLSIMGDPLDELVRDMVLTALPGPALAAARRAAAGDDQEQQQLFEQIAADERQLEDLEVAHFTDGVLSRSGYLKARQKIIDRMTVAQGTLSRRNGSTVLADLPTDEPSLRATWDAQSTDWRRSLVTAIVDHVKIDRARHRNHFDPQRVTVVWRA